MKDTDAIFEAAQEAIDKWGKEGQEKLAIGEIGELIELFGKQAQGRAESDNWADEIADVYILLPTLILLHTDRSKVEDRVSYKLERLEGMLENENGTVDTHD